MFGYASKLHTLVYQIGKKMEIQSPGLEFFLLASIKPGRMNDLDSCVSNHSDATMSKAEKLVPFYWFIYKLSRNKLY